MLYLGLNTYFIIIFCYTKLGIKGQGKTKYSCLVTMLMFTTSQECKDTLGFNLAAMDHLKVILKFMVLLTSLLIFLLMHILLILQQLMASRSDALFRGARSKLLEIRSHNSKRLEARNETREEKRRKKKNRK